MLKCVQILNLAPATHLEKVATRATRDLVSYVKIKPGELCHFTSSIEESLSVKDFYGQIGTG